MKNISRYVYYLYIPLIIGIVIALIALIVRVSKTLKKVGLTLQKTEPLNESLQKMNGSLEQIRKSKGNWTFFLSIFAVIAILKETAKYYRSEKSVSKSFTKALMRHGTQVRNLRF